MRPLVLLQCGVSVELGDTGMPLGLGNRDLQWQNRKGPATPEASPRLCRGQSAGKQPIFLLLRCTEACSHEGSAESL